MIDIDQLTESQQEAIESESARTLVIAGAGSGKTKVLVQRIVHLIQEKGASPSDMLVLTFTRDASAEMRQRLEADGIDCRDMMLGTFHAVALRMVMANAEALGYQKNTIGIIDVQDADMLLEDVATGLGYCSRKADGKIKWQQGLSGKRLRAYLDTYYSAGVHDSFVHRISTSPKVLVAIITEYHARLKQMNLLDFGMILVECHRLLFENPGVLAAYRSQIKYVMVDEIQDTDAIQYTLHQHFATTADFIDGADYFAVGDPRQTIYTFRGARPDLMESEREGAKVVELRECFRCADTVIYAANALISHNPDKVASMTGSTGEIGCCYKYTGRSECVVRMVKDCFAAGYAPSDIAIIARTHRCLQRPLQFLQEAGIPAYKVGGGFDVCKTSLFRDLFACLRLVVNPRDELAFMRIRGRHFRMSDATYAQMRAVSFIGDETLMDQIAGVPPATDLVALFTNCHRDPSNRHTYSVENAVGMIAPLLDGGGYDDEAVAFWRVNCAGMSVAGALEWYTMHDKHSPDGAKNAGDRVTLLTAHAAKGLEWPCVIIINLNEGTFPSRQSLKADDVVDERRLMYVAVTRAQSRLVLHWRRPEDQSDKKPISEPSRFLGEMGVL